MSGLDLGTPDSDDELVHSSCLCLCFFFVRCVFFLTEIYIYIIWKSPGREDCGKVIQLVCFDMVFLSCRSVFSQRVG